ncbi:hypothetical protein BJ742DRAFT_375649 [Cladochytrium replicatum]|nr:hypothetical protein BJ742DRAFT_375649 [Cladochytrium replicatum]
MRRTGLQREVLEFYKKCLRAALGKPENSRPHFVAFVRQEFRGHAKTIEVKDFNTIEYMLRRGKKQLEILGGSSVVDINANMFKS